MPCSSCCSRKRSQLKDGIEGKKRLCVWMLGGPSAGSGEGPQYEKIAAHFQLSNFSIRDLLRDIIKEEEDSPLANEIRATMERGDRVDTKIVLKLLAEAMEDAYPNCRGYLIDGYPRELKQGKLFCKLIGKPHLILYLNFPDYNILVESLLKGGEGSDQEDAKAEIIRRRMETYHRVSKPVIERWSSKVVRIDATGSPEDVEKDCINAIRTTLNDFRYNRT